MLISCFATLPQQIFFALLNWMTNRTIEEIELCETHLLTVLLLRLEFGLFISKQVRRIPWKKFANN
jgi:hypothetical protein